MSGLEKEYYARGCTALLDAIGGAIHHIGNVHKYARDEDRPEKTIFVITTDGYENSSRKYTAERVKQMKTSGDFENCSFRCSGDVAAGLSALPLYFDANNKERTRFVNNTLNGEFL